MPLFYFFIFRWQGVSCTQFSNQLLACFRFNFISCIACNGAALFGYFFFDKDFGFLFFVYLRNGSFCQHIEYLFQIAHIVSQIFFF